MVAMINVLQIGGDWSKSCQIPDNVEWQTELGLIDKAIKGDEVDEEEINFDTMVVSDFTNSNLATFLQNYAKPYTILYSDESGIIDKKIADILKLKEAVKVSMAKPQKLIDKIALSFFKGQSGSKLSVKDIEVSPIFCGSISYTGLKNLNLIGTFGEKLQPILTWKKNVFMDEGKKLEFWLEYEKDDSIELELNIRESLRGSTDRKQKSWTISGDELKDSFMIENASNIKKSTYLNFSLSAKGKGNLKIGNLHSRWTRFEFGQSIIGGKITADENRQELLYYFDPGDMKPPLNVYFSGYRSLEGFEGYNMMKKMGAPFILLSDPRNEGGAFYVGSDEFEQKIQTIILQALKKLGFEKNQLILSGMSMGAFGALYYGAKIDPKIIILGKPLINLGNIAKNGRMERPGEFDTALDLLLDQEGENSEKAAEKLNMKVWQVLLNNDFSKSTIAAAYMKDDDYDALAFKQIVNHFGKKGTKIIGKGWIGRHNDNSPAIVNWFVTQYIFFLEKTFGRVEK